MKQPIVVVGAGGFGRETLDVLEAVTQVSSQWELIGVLDDDPQPENLDRLSTRGITFLGGIRDWLDAGHAAEYVIAVGKPALRRSIAALFNSAGRRPATLVHPLAIVGSSVRIGAGSVICAGAVVSTNVTIGRHVHLNPNCTIGHDAELEDFVSVNPGAVVSGDCKVGKASLIGASATVLQGLVVGQFSTVGACACVVRDVAGGTTVKGVPAR